MHWGTIVLLGLATNLDNLCIGLAYGLSGKRIPLVSNLIIALISGGFAAAACALAQVLTGPFRAIAATAGAVLLIGLGLYTLYDALFRAQPEGGELKPLSPQETLTLGVSLAINCLGASFGVGLSAVSWLGLGFFVALFSFLAVGIGGHLGGRAALCQGRWLNVVSGLLLIAIAVWELFI